MYIAFTHFCTCRVAKGTKSGGAVSQFNLPISWDRAEWLAREVLSDYVVDQEDGMPMHSC